MKRITTKQRDRDVLRDLRQRRRIVEYKKTTYRSNKRQRNIKHFRAWVKIKAREGINISIRGKTGYAVLVLPQTMNFSSEYEVTAKHINIIREFTTSESPAFKLGKVVFDYLKCISTSAALVLTAELSRWDDILSQNLCPEPQKWDPDIRRRFSELGFFEIFPGSLKLGESEPVYNPAIKLVPYIKGQCGDNNKTRLLNEQLQKIIGDSIDKWTFLSCGLSEAITNVTHHAYPETEGYSEKDRYWYLSGSFNREDKELKVVFYDQGISIPKTLPESKLWERLLSSLSKMALADRMKDEVMLKAAVELERTSTNDSDRGKGLQDLLEFIKQRNNGYLSILSSRGLYKYSQESGYGKDKTFRFKEPVNGTLIIWRLILDID